MSQKKTHDEYVAELAIKNPNIEVIGNYNGNHVKIDHYCKIHNKIWGIAPANVLQGQGCSECRTEYCQKNDISLLRIRYDSNIEEKLNNFIHLI